MSVTFKVAVIDDKPMIRRAIVSTMDWKALDCEVIADAEDGIKAKGIIDHYKPDIIITDIRMPGFDGLELAAYAKEVSPHSKVIVITGYEVFDYAQKCVRLGVTEFLLKPINNEELSQVVARAVEQLQQSKQEQQDKELLLPSFKKQLFSDLLTGTGKLNLSVSEDQQLDKCRYALLVIRGRAAAGWGGETDNSESIEDKVQSRLTYKVTKGVQMYKIRILHDIVFVIVFDQTHSNHSASEVMKHWEKQQNQQLTSEERRKYPMEWSSVLRNQIWLKEQYQSLSRNLNNRFFNFTKSLNTNETKLSILHDLNQFTDMLNTLSLEDMDDQIQSFLDRIASYSAGNVVVAKVLLSEFCLAIVKHAYRKSHNELLLSRSVDELLADVNRLDDMEQASEYIRKLLVELNKQEQRQEGAFSSLVKSILNYINDHYSQEIGLNIVAEKFQVSPGHISRIMRKETGAGFVETVTRIRLEAAKRLMRDPTKRIQEISEMTGFKNYIYFYQVFKKYENKSPQDYKNTI